MFISESFRHAITESGHERTERRPHLTVTKFGDGFTDKLAATLIAGAAVDYLGRRRVSMISDTLSALSVVAVPVLALMFGADVVNVAVLAVVHLTHLVVSLIAPDMGK